MRTKIVVTCDSPISDRAYDSIRSHMTQRFPGVDVTILEEMDVNQIDYSPSRLEYFVCEVLRSPQRSFTPDTVETAKRILDKIDAIESPQITIEEDLKGLISKNNEIFKRNSRLLKEIREITSCFSSDAPGMHDQVVACIDKARADFINIEKGADQ